MKKSTLNEFIAMKDTQIREKERIYEILEHMWDIPFKDLFHSCWAEKEEYPDIYIRNQLMDQEVVPEDASMDELKYGEVTILLQEEWDNIPEDKKNKEVNNTLIQLGRIYQHE